MSLAAVLSVGRGSDVIKRSPQIGFVFQWGSLSVMESEIRSSTDAKQRGKTELKHWDIHLFCQLAYKEQIHHLKG